MKSTIVFACLALVGCGGSSETSAGSPAADAGADTADAVVATCKESLASFTARVAIPKSGHPYSAQTSFCADNGMSDYGASQCDSYEGASMGSFLAYYDRGSGALVAVFDPNSGACLAGDGRRCGVEIGIGVFCKMP
jgi:hypothetical protein